MSAKLAPIKPSLRWAIVHKTTGDIEHVFAAKADRFIARCYLTEHDFNTAYWGVRRVKLEGA
jgi:hypothetical protein